MLSYNYAKDTIKRVMNGLLEVGVLSVTPLPCDNLRIRVRVVVGTAWCTQPDISDEHRLMAHFSSQGLQHAFGEWLKGKTSFHGCHAVETRAVFECGTHYTDIDFQYGDAIRQTGTAGFEKELVEIVSKFNCHDFKSHIATNVFKADGRNLTVSVDVRSGTLVEALIDDVDKALDEGYHTPGTRCTGFTRDCQHLKFIVSMSRCKNITFEEAPPPLTANPDRLPLDEAYLQMAEVWGKRSKSNRTQVGALIVKDTRIISDGYNGLPNGDEPDVCEIYGENGELITKPEVLHAESNAITKLAAFGGPGAKGATLYVNLSPCFECAKLIHQSGIKRVVYRDVYRKTDGISELRKRGVELVHLKKEEE